MSAYVAWFVLGFILLIAELLTGTFYLLVLAVAAGVAALTALAGGSMALQLVVAAGIGLAGSLWLRRARAGRAGQCGRRCDAEPGCRSAGAHRPLERHTHRPRELSRRRMGCRTHRRRRGAAR
jgi:membrane protein implicated in regulation of membrane protease activity